MADDDEDEIEQVWQRVRAYAQQLLHAGVPIRTPSDYITEVRKRSIRKRSEKPKSRRQAQPGEPVARGRPVAVGRHW